MLSRSNIEYVEHGVNWISGCAHGCTYCYMQGMAARFDRLMPESGDWIHHEPRTKHPADDLIAELAAKTTLPQGTLMLSTSHDPAMSVPVAEQACGIATALGGFGLLDRTLFLTKAPHRALNALCTIGASEGLRFGTSLTSMGVGLTSLYEPGAELPADRVSALQRAAEQGYRVWVSIEPPLPDVYLHRMVEIVLDNLGDARPWIVLGKLNLRGYLDADLLRWAKSDHWAVDRDAAVALLQRAGYVNSLTPVDSGYWIKRELRETANA